MLGAVVNAVGLAHADATADGRADSSVLDTEMTRGEAATSLRQFREDLTGRFEGVGPAGKRSAVAITEWARETEERTTHEIRVEWDADNNSEN